MLEAGRGPVRSVCSIGVSQGCIASGWEIVSQRLKSCGGNGLRELITDIKILDTFWIKAENFKVRPLDN